MHLLGSYAFSFFTALPYFVQDSAIDIAGTLLINLLAIGFYFLGRAVMGLAITLVILLFVAIWARETDLLSKLKKKNTIVVSHQLQRSYSVAPVKITPMAVVEKLDDNFDSKVLYNGRFRSVDATDEDVMDLEDIETSSNGSMGRRSKRSSVAKSSKLNGSGSSSPNFSTAGWTNKALASSSRQQQHHQLTTELINQRRYSPEKNKTKSSKSSSSPAVDIIMYDADEGTTNAPLKSKKRHHHHSRRKDDESVGSYEIEENSGDRSRYTATLSPTMKQPSHHLRRREREDKESAAAGLDDPSLSSQVYDETSPGAASIKSVQSHFPEWHYIAR